MNVTIGKRVLSISLCLALVAITMPIEAGALMFYQDQQAAPAPSSSSSYPGQGAPMTLKNCKPGCADRALSRRVGGPDSGRGDVSGPDCGRQLLAPAKQEPHRHRSGAGREQAVVGPQRQGAHPVPFGAEQYGTEPLVDVAVGRGLSQPVGRRNGRDSNLARKSQSCRQPQVWFADYGGASRRRKLSSSSRQIPKLCMFRSTTRR